MNAKVENLKSRNGNAVPNQLRVRTDKGVYFQSYESIIVFVPVKGKTQLDSKFWNYSNTTSKYRNIFLNETTAETKKKIESGEYELVNLN